MSVDLLQGQCDPLELTAVLVHHFGSYSTHGLRTFAFTDPETGQSLTVCYTKRGSVVFSGNLSEARQAAIREEVRRVLIDNQELCIAEATAYASKPVRGQFTLDGQFQVLPIPESFLNAERAHGRLNPFRLRYLYNSSPELMVDASRWHREATKYATLLNAFLDATIQVERSWPDSGWVVEAGWPGVPSGWHQLGFTFPGQNGKPDEWQDTSEIPRLDRVPYEDYYTARDPDDTTLRIPSNLEESLAEALAMQGEDEARLTRAMRWLYQSVGLWEHSQSAAFIALVSALESLVEPVSPEPCATCKQPRYLVSQRFRSFLTEYVPGVDTFPKERDLLYQVRSTLVHGARLLERDLHPTALSFNLRFRRDVQLHEILERITTIALHNWLHSRNPHSPSLE